jgi:hypothetical protein
MNSSSENSSVQLTIPSSSTPVHIVVWQEKKGGGCPCGSGTAERTSMDTGILERLSALEKMVQQVLDIQAGGYTVGSRIPFFPESIHPLPDGIEEIRSVHILEEDAMEEEEDRGEEDSVKEVHVIKLDQPSAPFMEEPPVKQEMKRQPTVLRENIVQIVEAKVLEEEEVEEVEEVEEEEVDGAEEEEGEEEDGEALEEFEWKGVTYYRDSEKNVYRMDEDGDLQDEPVGRWNEEKQKVVRFAATPAASAS